MTDPDGTRHTRLSLIAEKEPGAYRSSLDASAYEPYRHRESAAPQSMTMPASGYSRWH
jgi:hypothetical protein